MVKHQVLTTLLLLAVLSGSTTAWVSNAPTTRRTVLQATMDRRIILAGAAAFLTFPARAEEATTKDPLDVFTDYLSDELAGETQLQAWPHSPSPLPTSMHSARELTMPMKGESNVRFAREGLTAMSDLEKALQESAKKKQVGPTTHG